MTTLRRGGRLALIVPTALIGALIACSPVCRVRTTIVAPQGSRMEASKLHWSITDAAGVSVTNRLVAPATLSATGNGADLEFALHGAHETVIVSAWLDLNQSGVLDHGDASAVSTPTVVRNDGCRGNLTQTADLVLARVP